MPDWDRVKVWFALLAGAATFVVVVLEFLHDIGLLE